MSHRRYSFGFMISAVLAAGLLLWPTTAEAADRDDEDRIHFKPALDFGMGGSGAKSSSFSLRLYGGFSRIAAGDLNEGLDGYFELLELYFAGSGTQTGGYSPLHTGYNVGADLVYQITPAIGIGLGAGYMRFSKDSFATWSDIETWDEIRLAGTPTLSAIPIRLGLFFDFPLGGDLNLTANAGAAYYAGLKIDAFQRIDIFGVGGSWDEEILRASRSSLANLGFHGSLGLEYMLSPKTGFFVEVLGRSASFKNFDTATYSYRGLSGSGSTEGKIYLRTERWSSAETWSLFIVSEDPPTSSPPDVVYTEPKIDLSGFSLQAGIRIRF